MRSLDRLLLVLALCSGCGTSNDDDDTILVFATQGHAPGGPLLVEGNWMIYLEEETSPAGVQDLNGNGVMTDSVAVAVSMGGLSVFPLGVAPAAVHVVGHQIYMEVVEADDGRDWNGDTMLDDFVLVHWTPVPAAVPPGFCTPEGVCYVDDLMPAAGTRSAVLAGARLYYTANIPDMTLMMSGDGATTLRALEQGAPFTPIDVMHLDTGQRRPRIAHSDEDGVLFLTYDETVELLDLNGDGDQFDNTVLALLDAGIPTRGIRSTGLAVPGSDSPLRARRNNAGTDWLTAFYVSESDQGAVSLNDRDDPDFMGTGWEPVQCANRDTDATDVVLHFLHFEPWFADPVLSPARNTGLVGRDPMMEQRLSVVEGFVGTVSDEASADCDLNVDTDTADSIPRWTQAVFDPMAAILPPGVSASLHALATALPGGSLGMSTLSNRFVIVVDETADADDVDANGQMEEIVAWLDPLSTTLTTWSFQHVTGSTNPSVGAAWMSREERLQRLAVAFQESVQGTSLNAACQDLSSADGDTLDELPTWAFFSSGSLGFPGVGVALSPARAGIVLAGFFAYFRISEVEHGRDVNGDGDATDILLMRNSLFACEPEVVGVTVDDTTPDGTLDALCTDGVLGGAFVASETDAGLDLNGNGFVGEDVIRYIVF